MTEIIETRTELETKTEEPKEDEAKESPLKIDSWDELYNAMCIIRGIDPNQMQSMAKFSNFDNADERSYYPTQYTSVAISQLRMFGKALYRGSKWNEYDLAADILAVGFMGFKGFKSEQYKDITSGQPNLDKLHGLPEETKKGILAGLFGKGRSE